MAELYRYAAFISYSSKDAAFAKRLHRALEGYGIPSSLGQFDLIGGGGKRNRVYPVFRDREELSAGHLGDQIEASLRASAALVVVCSPYSAASPWVQKEIEFFASLGRHGKVFAIIPDTAPLTDEAGADCTPSCFPSAFRGDALTGDKLEPLAADARKGKDGFRNAWLKIVAGMIGVTPGQIIDRDKKQRRQRAISGLGGGLALAATLLLFALFPLSNQLQARSDTLAELAHNANEEGHNQRAARYALAGLNVWRQPLLGYSGHAAEAALRRAALGAHRIAQLSTEPGAISSIAFSPDGARFATIALDNSVAVRAARDGRLMASFQAQSRIPGLAEESDYVRREVRFSRDGSIIITQINRILALHDANTGERMGTFPLPPDGAGSFNHDLSRIVIVDYGVAKILELLSMRVLRLGDQQRDAEFNADGTRVVTISENGVLHVWNAASGRELTRQQTRGSRFSLSSDGSRVAVEGPDGVQIVDIAGDSLRFTAWITASNPILSADGARVLTTSLSSGEAKLWSADTGELLAVLSGGAPSTAITTAAFSPDGTRIITGASVSDPQQDSAQLHSLSVWDTGGVRTVRTLNGYGHNNVAFNPQGRTETSLYAVSYSPDGSRLVTACYDGTVRVWDVSTGEMLFALSGHEGSVWSASFSSDGAHILTASSDKTARIWDAATGRLLTTLSGHPNEVSRAVFSPDGSQVVTASGPAARLWDTASGRLLDTLSNDEGRITDVQFSPDGSRVVTAHRDTSARVWDAQSGNLTATLRGHGDVVWTAAFSPDGSRIVTASEDKSARIWDADTGRLQSGLGDHEYAVQRASFSPDGSRVVTTSRGTAMLWDARNGRRLTTLSGHRHFISQAIFSHDGSRLVTTSIDHTARVWDTRSGRQIAVLMGHRGAVYRVGLSPDGSHIVTGSEDGTARVWELPRQVLGMRHALMAEACTVTLAEGVGADARPALFADQEMDAARLLDRTLDRDVCAETPAWRRLTTAFGVWGYPQR
jgi:WD40 repeat protein